MIGTLLYLLIFLILLTAAYGAWSAAPWLPTRKRDVERMLDLAEVKGGDVVYDLGCGDGRLVFAAAKRGAQARGIEIFILPWLYAWFKSLTVKGTKIYYGDLFSFGINDADVVFIFLLDKSYKKLIEKFKRELKPGCRVVISSWEINDWKDKLIKEDKPSDKDLPMYLYKM